MFEVNLTEQIHRHELVLASYQHQQFVNDAAVFLDQKEHIFVTVAHRHQLFKFTFLDVLRRFAVVLATVGDAVGGQDFHSFQFADRVGQLLRFRIVRLQVGKQAEHLLADVYFGKFLVVGVLVKQRGNGGILGVYLKGGQVSYYRDNY